jgi:hypothetical protein
MTNNFINVDVNSKELVIKSDGQLPNKCNLGIVIDLSASMSNYKDSLKGAIDNIIDYCILNSNVSFKLSFVFFSSEVDFKNYDETSEFSVIKTEVKEKISNFPMHSTNLSGGIAKGLELIENEDGSVSTLICLTDGIANVGERNLSTIGCNNSNQIKNKNIQMYMVAFGNNPPLNLSKIGSVFKANTSEEFANVVENTLNFAIQSIGSEMSISTVFKNGESGLIKNFKYCERVNINNISELSENDCRLVDLNINTGQMNYFKFRNYQVQDFNTLKSNLRNKNSSQQFMFDIDGNLFYIGMDYRCYPIIKECDSLEDSEVTYTYDSNIVNNQPLYFIGLFSENQKITIKIKGLNNEIIEKEYIVNPGDILKPISPDYENHLFDDLVGISIPEGCRESKYLIQLLDLCPLTATNQYTFLKDQINLINSGQYNNAYLSREVESGGRDSQRYVTAESSGYR